ncbi:MAG: radical SAM protein [Infirmifilum sp.]|uniref:radical SAM protein n=1 Tax=Infirmifilum TaxID=2856573 RepID=UPI0023546B90
MNTRSLPTGSIVYGRLPPGCKLCQEGLKTIIFLTGLCPLSCFYCPLSTFRKNRDVTFVNEVQVDESNLDRTAVLEVLRSASRGASLTGGEPLVKVETASRIIRSLKDTFGEKFHIHLYTSAVPLTNRSVEKLVDSGLDELRIHAPRDILEEKLRIASEYKDKLLIGLEYPALPGNSERLFELAETAEKYEAAFMNLNELEFTETNSSSLLLRGYKMRKDYRSAMGSKETALDVIRRAEEKGLNLTIHFCPVRVKDYQQTGLRYYRAANLLARPYQLVTDDGTTLEVTYTELKQEKKHIAEYYRSSQIHFFLMDAVKQGKIVERSPLLNWMSLEETPLDQEKSEA